MINLSSFDQEKYLNQISKTFEYQSNLIKIYPSSKNFSKCFLDTASLISLLKIDYLTPSNYYLLYTDTSDLLQETIEYYIRDNVSKGIKIKYIYESIQQCQYVIPRIYLMIICGSIHLELYPIKFREIIFDLLNAVKCIQNPLRGFWIRYFLVKNLKNILPIKIGEYINNEEYFYMYRDISLNFLMVNLEELALFAMRTKKEIYIDDKKMDEKQRINMISCIEEVIEEISNIKGLDKNIFVNKILPKMFDIVCYLGDKNDNYLELIIIASIIKYFKIELYFESQGITIIFIFLRKIIDNKEINKISIFNNLLNNYLKFMKNLKKNKNESLRNESIATIINTFPLLLEKYNELQITYKNSEEKEFNKFIDLDTFFMKFSLKVLKQEKDEKKISIINTVLNSCLKRLNMFNYGFKIETIKKICSLIEIPLKHKFTVFEFPIIETMIYYLDYNHRKQISLKLIESFENNLSERSKIDSLEKIHKIINLIIPLITEANKQNEEEDLNEYFDEEDKNKHLCKLVYIINSKKPEIILQMLIKIKAFYNSGSIETEILTIPSIINFIINYMKKLVLFYEDFICNSKYKENNKEIKEFEFDILIDNKEDNKKVELCFIELIRKFLNILKECILIIENKIQIQAFQIYLLVCCEINKMNLIFQSNKNLLNETFQGFFQKAINIFKNVKEQQIKYRMFHYLCGYLQSSTLILEKEKIKNLINFFENEFSSFNDTEIRFNININICDLYFFVLKGEENIENYVNKAFQIAESNLESVEHIKLLITLINKILIYSKKLNGPLFIEIINNVINRLKNSIFLANRFNDEDSKEIHLYYNNTIEYIKKIKKQNNISLYDSIIL